MEDLTESLRNTRLSGSSEESEQLLFRPHAGSGLASTALNEIPRYLFRVVSPHSDGATNEIWTRSESAYRNWNSSREDIFSNLNSEKRTTIARTLNVHLRWWPKEGLKDNFVSWTSSLLFAIQYIYYRHLSPKDGSSLEQIRLYAIDTKQFPRGTFLCDLDLIDAFWESDNHLENFRYLRNETKYYFGEYLSQGSLKIEGKCEVIPAQILFESDRLARLQSQFRKFHDFPFDDDKPRWAKEVIRLRETIWRSPNPPSPSLAERTDSLMAVKEIVQGFQPSWRLPLAIYFSSLIGPESLIESRGAAIYNNFLWYLEPTFPDGNKALPPSNMKIIAPETMPEVKQVEKIVREQYKYYTLDKALDQVRTAEASIRGLHLNNVFSEDGHAFVLADPNDLLDRTGQALLAKLRTVQKLCDQVILAISPNMS